jgi:hypothetical protein
VSPANFLSVLNLEGINHIKNKDNRRKEKLIKYNN